MRKLLMVLLGAALLSACSQDSEDKKTPVMLEGPLKARDKALGVQETLNQGAELQARQIEEQTQQ